MPIRNCTLDPMRLAQPRQSVSSHMQRLPSRIGPDWLALRRNWMTEWERAGNHGLPLTNYSRDVKSVVSL